MRIPEEIKHLPIDDISIEKVENPNDYPEAKKLAEDKNFGLHKGDWIFINKNNCEIIQIGRDVPNGLGAN